MDNFNQDSTHQTGQVTSKERNSGEHKELQADRGKQDFVDKADFNHDSTHHLL